MTTRRTLNTILLLAALALAGCDDVLLFDVAPDGRVLVAIDGRGKVVGVGDGSKLRHLVVVDPRDDSVGRLTDAGVALSWPRFCGPAGGDVVFVERRKTLVLLGKDGSRRVLLESARRLEQPTPSPSGDRVAVLEVAKLGLPGLLHVVDVATGAAGVPLDGAILGFAWTPRGDLLVPRLGAGVAAAAPFEGGPGEVLHLRGPQGEDRRVLYSGPLAGVVWLSAGAICVLPRGAEQVGLARLAPDGSGATLGEQTEALDLWPAALADGRVLFTRSRPGRPTLEGELRLTRADALESSTRIPTPGPMCAPRWVGTDRVAYLTPDDRLVTQGLDGRGVVDWTERLLPLAGDLP